MPLSKQEIIDLLSNKYEWRKAGTKGHYYYYLKSPRKKFVVLTASKGSAEDTTKNMELVKELGSKGYRVYKQAGRSKQPSGRFASETSYVVFDLPISEAVALGKKYGQSSILKNNIMVYTTGRERERQEVFGGKQLIGKEAAMQPYHSVMQGVPYSYQSSHKRFPIELETEGEAAEPIHPSMLELSKIMEPRKRHA